MMAPMISTANTPTYIKSARIALTPQDANGTDHPDEEEWCRDRKADGGFVRGIAPLHRFKPFVFALSSDSGITFGVSATPRGMSGAAANKGNQLVATTTTESSVVTLP